jgi:hypothetical protein
VTCSSRPLAGRAKGIKPARPTLLAPADPLSVGTVKLFDRSLSPNAARVIDSRAAIGLFGSSDELFVPSDKLFGSSDELFAQ